MASSRLPPDFVARLAREHRACNVPVGIGEAAAVFARDTLGVLFAHHAVLPRRDDAALAAAIEQLRVQLAGLLALVAPRFGAVVDAAADVDRFMAQLPAIHAALYLDADANDRGDPAATSRDEVILAYPGFRAVALYRIAHALHEFGVPLLPRSSASWRTGKPASTSIRAPVSAPRSASIMAPASSSARRRSSGIA